MVFAYSRLQTDDQTVMKNNTSMAEILSFSTEQNCNISLCNFRKLMSFSVSILKTVLLNTH